MASIFSKTDLDLDKPLTPAQGLIMMASYPKSGNTWTRLFFYALNSRTKEIDLDHFSKSASTLDAQKTHFGQITGMDPNELTDDQIAKAVPLVQKYLALRKPTRELVKTHMLNGEWSGTPTMNFSVIRGVIYILRNPLDVVASYAAHMNLTTDQAITSMCRPLNWLRAKTKEEQDDAPQVPQLMGSWSQHVAGWTGKPDPRVTIVRYEDLKAEPVTHFKRMVDGLGFRKTRAEVAEAVQKTDFAQIQKKEAKSGFRESVRDDQKFFRKGQTGGWREELTDEQIKIMIRHHAFQMNRFGYIPVEYHDFAKEVLADSQTAKHFISMAKKEQSAAAKNIRRRAKPGKKAAAQNARTAQRVNVMFPSAIKASGPMGR